MFKLEILEKNGYTFNFKDSNNKLYTLNIELLDVKENIKAGDFISISAELLNPKYAGYSLNYTFGNLESKYGKENIQLDDIDVIKIETEDKEIYLKRLYG